MKVLGCRVQVLGYMGGGSKGPLLLVKGDPYQKGCLHYGILWPCCGQRKTLLVKGLILHP